METIKQTKLKRNHISVIMIASVLQTAIHVPQPEQFWGLIGTDLPS
jgi:hypothetical protein